MATKQLPIISKGVRIDPLQGLKFRVYIAGVTDALGFSKITGMEGEITSVVYREGTNTTTDRKLPGRVQYPILTFEKGLDPSGFMHEWFKQIVDLEKQNNATSKTGIAINGDFRKKITIELFSRDGGIPRISWEVQSAWISKLSIGDIDAQSDDVIIETAEITHEGLFRVSAVESNPFGN